MSIDEECLECYLWFRSMQVLFYRLCGSADGREIFSKSFDWKKFVYAFHGFRG